jgi:hypothetical protein
VGTSPLCRGVYEIFECRAHSTTLYHNGVDIYVECDDVTQKRAQYANIFVIFNGPSSSALSAAIIGETSNGSAVTFYTRAPRSWRTLINFLYN